MGKINPIFLAICLIFFVLAIAAIVTLVILYLQAKNSQPTTKNPPVVHPTLPSVNQSQGRIQAAAFLTQGLDSSADPCQDFYTYACGKWAKNNPMPHGRRLYDTLTKLQDNVNEKIYIAMMAMDIGSSKTPEALKKTRKIFNACTDLVEMDRSHVGKKPKNPVVQLLINSQIGMWPLLQMGWAPSKQKLSYEGLAGFLSSNYAVDTFLSAQIMVDWGEPNKHRLYLDQADLTLGSRVFYINDTYQPVLRQYRDTIEAAARSMATNYNNGFVSVNLAYEADQIVNFEMNLAEIMTEPASISFKKAYNPYSSSKLKQEFPNFDWFKYFSKLLPIDLHFSQQGPVSKVILLNPDYMEKLTLLLERSDKKTVYNYLVWKLIYSRLWALSSQYRDLHRSMRESLDISREAEPHSMQCVAEVTEKLPFAIGRLFVDGKFDPSIRPFIHSLVGSLKLALKSNLQNATWMDKITKIKAGEKVDAIVVRAAYPSWISNDTALNLYYKDLKINKDPDKSFFDIYNNLTTWLGLKAAYELLKPASRSEHFGDSPALSNAWYSPEYNSVTVPAGILQSPVFQLNYPAPVLYGGIGTIIAHELMHGFDNQGVQFGANGSISNWFDDFSKKKYQEKERCFVDEYNHYCYQSINMCVNGQKTLGENLADNGGVMTAYTAFKNWELTNINRVNLPGLENFTGDQLFFLSFARLWCGQTDIDVVKQQILLNPHPPDKVRVLGTLKNIPEFVEAFKCSKTRSILNGHC